MKYIVIEGTFLDSDGTTKGPGQSIELDDAMAAHHGERVRPDAGEAAVIEAIALATELPAAEAQAPALVPPAEFAEGGRASE